MSEAACHRLLSGLESRAAPEGTAAPEGATRQHDEEKARSCSTHTGHLHPEGPRRPAPAGTPTTGKPAASNERRLIRPTLPSKDGEVDWTWLDLPNPASPRGLRTERAGCPTRSALIARRLLAPEGGQGRHATSPLSAVTPRGADGRRRTVGPARPPIGGAGSPKRASSNNRIPPHPGVPPDGGAPFRGGQAPELGWLRSMKSGTSAPREMQQMIWGSSTSGGYSPRESVSVVKLVRADPGPMLSWASASSGISPP
jgi:hypothetical protein